ncbi:hypothetical protein BU23DRAFT_306587 [Bimuria novae-zelandiae CBS 107.79]|uniref:Autophagy-related protein 29 n=1 Tax=Bimuria novae-zelandiae CBS 107.79 TaxID=1447943 RepID=A0A6A5UPR0_9PLEO|nr:hypothetical protein BU23DRAFT_306587 [Bimuria novae-zelandiae CBS 107.79]
MSRVQFTVLLRVPFTRADFIDPQQASWDSSKDRELWRYVSKSSKTKDLDWVRLAIDFNVPPAFLLQQAAWLYERHLDHVRAQMKKVGGQCAPTLSGIDSGHVKAGASTMDHRSSDSAGAPRYPSLVTKRQKDDRSVKEPSDTSAGPTFKPALSRTPSTNTITQSRALAQSTSIQNSGPGHKLNEDRTRTTRLNSDQSVAREFPRHADGDSPTDPPSSGSSSSLSNSDRDNPATRSQLFKRPPRFKSQPPRELLTHEEEVSERDDFAQSINTEHPFANVAQHGQAQDRMGDIMRQPASREQQAIISPMRPIHRVGNVETNAIQPTSAHRKIPSGKEFKNVSTGPAYPPPHSPISNQRAETTQMSPGRGGAKISKESSEGAPSMGSSFSDIDDTSISQSALEEALLSNIQHGRMSTLSQLRSRYL